MATYTCMSYVLSSPNFLPKTKSQRRCEGRVHGYPLAATSEISITRDDRHPADLHTEDI